VILPAHYGVSLFALFFGINGIWLAHKLFWERQRQIFWFSAGAIVIGIGCLVPTGAADSIARWLWPLTLDPAAAEKFRRQLPCEEPRLKGLAVIMAPIVLILVPVWLLKMRRERRSMRILATLVLATCIALLYGSPLPERLARSVFPEDALKVPSHCTQVKR
jgi:hypothetical protein